MGKLLTCLRRLTLAQLRPTLWSTTERTCRRDLEISHGPDGIFTCIALLLAGRRCAHQQWHGDLLIVHHHWQLSWICACSRSKVPIAPMGKLLTRLLGFTLAQLLAQLRLTLWSTTVCTCRRDLQKFPSPRWENADALALILACTTVTDASMNYSMYVPQRP